MSDEYDELMARPDREKTLTHREWDSIRMLAYGACSGVFSVLSLYSVHVGYDAISLAALVVAGICAVAMLKVVYDAFTLPGDS